jgi:hypothetical protein
MNTKSSLLSSLSTSRNLSVSLSANLYYIDKSLLGRRKSDESLEIIIILVLGHVITYYKYLTFMSRRETCLVSLLSKRLHSGFMHCVTTRNLLRTTTFPRVATLLAPVLVQCTSPVQRDCQMGSRTGCTSACNSYG